MSVGGCFNSHGEISFAESPLVDGCGHHVDHLRVNPERMAAPELSEYLRTQRTSAGLSQRKLASILSVNPRYIRRLETGDRAFPSEDLLRRIAAALAIDPNTLLQIAGRS